MELKLYGHLSYIDKYNKLQFTYLQDSHDKLERHCTLNIRPYTKDGFHVTYKKSSNNGLMMQKYIGLDCVIRVKINRYSFTSKLKQNAGAKLIGNNLLLLDIALCTENDI